MLETFGGCDDLLNTLLSSDGIVESFESGINGNGKCCAVGLVGWLKEDPSFAHLL